MDEKKIIRKYIGDVKPAIMALGLLLLLATLGGIFMALRAHAQELPEPTPFDALEGEEHSYSYIDVIGVSDWIYTYDDATYYILENTDFLLNVGRLSDGEFARLKHQNDYWNDLTDVERPVRLTGVTLAMTSTMKDNFMDVWELTGEEFDDYFGYRSFYAGTTPREENVSMWTGISMMLGLFSAFILVGCGISLSREYCALKRLEEAGQLPQAAEELESSLTERVRKDRLRLGARYVFGRHVGLAAPWEDVLWCYERVTRYYGIVAGHVLVICTADGKSHAIDFGRNGEEELLGVMETIHARNPRALFGFNRENRRAWKEQCR